MAAANLVAGGRCPCGSYATVEPGGVICRTAGHTFLFRRILPRDHEISPGRDWRNRARQRALDRAYMHPGNLDAILTDLIYDLEGRPALPAN